MKRYSLQVLVVAFLLICTIGKSYSAEYGFLNPINLSCGVTADSMGEQIIRDGANLYIVCPSAFLKSTDDGKTFQSTASIGGGDHSMAVDKNGVIYIVYSVGASGSWFTKSIDKGASFSQPVYLQGDSSSFVADVAVADNGDIFVASGGYGGFTIFKSIDGGLTFNALNTAFINGSHPHTIVAKNGKLHIAWGGYGDGNLYYTYSDDGGATFATVINVSGSLGPMVSQLGSGIISLIVDEISTVHIAWPAAQNLYVSSKKNSESNFVAMRIETTGLHPLNPSITNDFDGHLYVTWYQIASQGTTDTGTFFTRSDANGGTYLPAKRISGTRLDTSITTNAEQDALVFAGSSFYKSIHCTADSCNLH